MGCFSSKPSTSTKGKDTDAFKRPQWKSDSSWDEAELQRKREEFWDTQPAYGGAKEIWDALKAVTSDLDNPNNRLILESAGIVVHGNDLRTTYDERGFKYDLPNYIISEPANLSKQKRTTGAETTASPASQQPQIEYES